MALARIKGTTSMALLWSPLVDAESSMLDQVRNAASLPWVYPHVASMADAHTGYGIAIGTVLPLLGAVSPAAVGVDIGCGMAAVKTNLTAADLPEDLADIRSAMEAAIPVGFNSHSHVPKVTDGYDLWADFARLNRGVGAKLDRARSQMGTLGGGNHYLEHHSAFSVALV